MKRTKLMKKITAMMLTGILVTSMGGITAFAEPTETNLTEVGTISKKINKPANVLTPATDFEFQYQYVGETSGSENVNADAVKNALSFSNNGKIAATGTEAADVTTGFTYSQTISVSLDLNSFSVPGVYRYKIWETQGTYEGIGYDSAEKYLDVTIGYNGEENALSVISTELITISDEEGSPKAEKTTGTFTNEYGVGNADGKLGNLTVEKVVSGTQGEKGKKFNFNITITGREDGEEFYIVGSDGTTKKTENGIANMQIIGGQSFTIYGLSESDSYVIAETNYGDAGYKTTYVITDAVGEVQKSTGDHDYDTNAVTLRKDDTSKLSDATAVFTNTKNPPTPTGIAMTFAPYVVMVAFAGVFAVMFLRKKREDF